MLKTLHVRRRPGTATQGIMVAGGRRMVCALGRSGMVSVKREGDGGTPIGRMRLLSAMVRADRVDLRALHLPLKRIGADDGWCDAVGDSNYNKSVPLPYPASNETLKREDRLYDIVVVMDHNVTRRMRCGGSAIFFHVAKPGYPPTEGCVALSPRDMAWLVRRVDRRTTMVVS